MDADLVRRIVGRDRVAFDAVYGRYAAAAYGIARRVLRDSAMAEDVVQEAFLELWRRPERFDPGRGTLRAWLLTIVHRRSVDAVRRSAARPTVACELDDLGPPADDAQEIAFRHVDADRVRRALAALPEEQRRALLLAYWGGHTQAEIAALTGVPLGTVKSRIFMGCRRLRAQLASAGDAE